jgi:hypothetical protein
MVRGRDGPLRSNSVLLAVAEVTVTVPPVAVRVAVRFLLAPTVTLPKAKLLGLTANWPAATPVPERAIERVASDAFETKDMLPLAAPATWGAKLRVKVKLCPAVSVRGVLSPLMLNPAPVSFACVTVRLEPPESVKVAVCVLLLPTCKLPKFNGAALRVPGVTPAPERGTPKAELEALLVTARVALLLPADCGENTTLNDALAPAARVMGKLRPLTLYAAPAATWVRVRLALPVLLNFSARV